MYWLLIKGCPSFLCWFRFRFEHVPLVTPNGDVLVNDLSFEVNNLLVAFDSQLTAFVSFLTEQFSVC